MALKFGMIVAAAGLLIGATAAYGLTILNAPGGNDTSLTGGEAFASEQAGVGSFITLGQIDGYVGAGGESIVNDITAAPYNAVCNGTADDSIAFEAAVGDGGVFYIPPGSRCKLSSTSSHSWTTDTTFYGLAGARDDTHIDIDSGINFNLLGGSLSLQNLTIKNGGDFADIGALNATFNQIECINNVWDAVESLCVRSSGISPNSSAEILSVEIHHNRYINPGSSDRGLVLIENPMYDVKITNNYMSGGKFGMRIVDIRNDDASGIRDTYRRIIVSDNIVQNILGTTSSGTVGCVQVMGINVIVADNVCENIDNTTDVDDTECFYSKARNLTVTGNVLMDCGNQHGFMRIVGDDELVCTTGPCGNRTIIANNVFRLERATPAGQFKCLLLGSYNVIVANNIFSGCTYRGIETEFLSSGLDIIITGNIFEDMRSIIAISIIDDYENVIISNNLFSSYDGPSVSTFTAIEVETNSGDTITNVQIHDNNFRFTDNGDTTTAIHLDVDGTHNDISIVDNYFGSQDVGIRVDGTGTLNRLTIHGNDLEDPTDPYSEAGGTTVNSCEVFGNRGWKAVEGDSCDGTGGGQT